MGRVRFGAAGLPFLAGAGGISHIGGMGRLVLLAGQGGVVFFPALRVRLLVFLVLKLLVFLALVLGVELFLFLVDFLLGAHIEGLMQNGAFPAGAERSA